jgi:hypothetical protein
VATIQAKQDEIIRLDHPEVLVIEDAQRTGNTHRQDKTETTTEYRIGRGVGAVGGDPASCPW